VLWNTIVPPRRAEAAASMMPAMQKRTPSTIRRIKNEDRELVFVFMK
jgi:hypothetical protein